jgi:hypothetical protein
MFTDEECGRAGWLYVCGVRQADLGHGWDDLREDAAAAADVFRAIWMLTSSRSGVSAKELERELGIGYESAWLMLYKLRRAMVRPGRNGDKLSGDIEVDDGYLGGPSPGGKRGRGADGKVIVGIAVERKGEGVGKSRNGGSSVAHGSRSSRTSRRRRCLRSSSATASLARRSIPTACRLTRSWRTSAMSTTRRTCPRGTTRPTSLFQLSIASPRS